MSPSPHSRLSLFTFFVIGVLAIATRALVIEDKVQQVAFDGQYTHPTPENGGVEWKYFQLVEDSKRGGIVASISILFFQGYVIQVGPRDPSLPQSYLDVSGTYHNGSTFAFIVPAKTSKITSRGQDVTGIWGDVARFDGSPNFSTYTAEFTAPQFGLTGSFKMTSRGEHHVNCNTSTSFTTFTSAIPPGTELTPAENTVFNDIGWMTSIPGGSVTAELVVKGTKLSFSGLAYHDANYSPAPLNAVADTWYSAVGQIGPYDLGFMYLVPVNSSRILSIGHLALGDTVLQNQCEVNGTKSSDIMTIVPYGIVKDVGTNTDVPAGFILEYTLTNGDLYRFNMTSPGNTQIVDQIIYHRWIGRIKGGKVGGMTYEGPFLYEWLNSELRAYVPPS